VDHDIDIPGDILLMIRRRDYDLVCEHVLTEGILFILGGELAHAIKPIILMLTLRAYLCQLIIYLDYII
jgi:hypothetical protein